MIIAALFFNTFRTAEPSTTYCYYCEQPMTITNTGISHHLDQDGNIDHDADANHVALDDNRN